MRLGRGLRAPLQLITVVFVWLAKIQSLMYTAWGAGEGPEQDSGREFYEM